MNLVFPSRARVLWSLSFLAIGAAGCHHADEAPQADQTKTIAVVATAARSPMQNTLHVAGGFLPMQEVELHAKVAGYIRRINVDIGDHVHAGQVLATLDVPELSAQVEGADAGVRQTQEQISRAGSEVQRAQADHAALHAAAQRLQQASNARPGLIAQQELDDALAKDRAAEAQVDAAKSGLSATQQQLGVSRADRQRYSALADYSRIVAPFDGIVTWRYADTGSLIQAGTSNAGSMPVVKVAQVSTLRLRLPVPESLAAFVKVGDTATINVQALGQTFPGRVTRNTGSLDPATRTMQVEIDVPNSNGKLSPGMYADVSLNVQRSGDALAVPVQAVDQSGSQPFVLLVNSSNRVEKRIVRVGISGANRVEILSGLNPGDKVITANLATFQEGQVVSPKLSAMGDVKADGGDQ
jgi:RND family efflux transporter MFP subunit